MIIINVCPFHSYFALLGTNLLTDVEKRVPRRLCRIAVHKKFDHKNFHNDIAIAELNEPVDITGKRIRTICLPSPTTAKEVSEQTRVSFTRWQPINIAIFDPFEWLLLYDSQCYRFRSGSCKVDNLRCVAATQCYQSAMLLILFSSGAVTLSKISVWQPFNVTNFTWSWNSFCCMTSGWCHHFHCILFKHSHHHFICEHWAVLYLVISYQSINTTNFASFQSSNI